MSFNPLVPSRNRQLRSDPFALLQNEIDVLFDDFGRGFFQTRSGDLVPRVDVSETENALEVTAELPGLELKDVQIEFSDDVLTIKGEKNRRTRSKKRIAGSLSDAMGPSSVPFSFLRESILPRSKPASPTVF